MSSLRQARNLGRFRDTSKTRPRHVRGTFQTLPRHVRGTSPQAQNLGRFLNESLKLLGHWKSGEEVYRNECAKLPGFSTSFINQQANAKKASYEDFVKAIFSRGTCKALTLAANH